MLSDNEPTEEKVQKETLTVTFDRSRSPELDEGRDLSQQVHPEKSMLLEQVGGGGDDTDDQGQ